MLKILLIFFGTISLTLGVVGIFVPGLPTTPFLLLTAGLYVRSSEKLYHRLIANRLLGSFISDFQREKGLTLSTKLYSITAMWIMIFISVVFLVTATIPKIVIIGAGITGTIVMGFILPTIRHQ
jgi:uncharacterized membrane protein YbaN (DUF454 family)